MPLQGKHAVMGVDAGEKMVDAVDYQSLSVAPTETVDVGVHGGPNTVSNLVSVRSGASGQSGQRLLAQQFAEVGIVGG